MVGAHDAPGYVQPQAVTRYLIPDGTPPVKPFKNPLLILARDSGAVVRHLDRNCAIGSVNADAIQRRRVMSRSSGLSSSSEIPLGSSAIPQMGQVPGEACSISGCIGQV